MKRRKRLEITFETRRLIIRRNRAVAAVWCVECASPVPWVTPEEGAALTGVSTRLVYRRVEAGSLHYMEEANGRTRICLDSLLSVTSEEGRDLPEFD